MFIIHCKYNTLVSFLIKSNPFTPVWYYADVSSLQLLEIIVSSHWAYLLGVWNYYPNTSEGYLVEEAEYNAS